MHSRESGSDSTPQSIGRRTGDGMTPEREEKDVWVGYVESNGVTCDEEARLIISLGDVITRG